MISTPKITIGIPTYNRSESLREVLENLADLYSSNPVFHVLIIDDSTSTTCISKNSSLSKEFNHKLPLSLYKNKNNLGFAGSFIRLLEHCSTDYMVSLADDDFIVKDHFKEITSFALNKDIALLSPQWIYKDRKRLGRGVSSTRPVKDEEFRLCSEHAPGLVLHVPSYQEEIPRVKERIEKGCSATITYPLVTFTAGIIAKEKSAFWYNKPIAIEGGSKPSGIKDHSGNHYSSLNSRIQQIADFDSMLLSLPEIQARESMLFESRAWSIRKALSSDKMLRERVKTDLRNDLRSKIKRRFRRFMS